MRGNRSLPGQDKPHMLASLGRRALRRLCQQQALQLQG